MKQQDKPLKLIWNEKYDIMAFYEDCGSFGEITVLDEFFTNNSFIAYSLDALVKNNYWVDLGEL